MLESQPAHLRALLLVAALSFAGAARADEPLLHELAGAPSASEIEATVRTFVGFGTRHEATGGRDPAAPVAVSGGAAESR